ncbi:MAG: chemotaxis protein CheX [Lachnospiraceae bacterium]|nr:chemotaxis protein CheX [Lachnospiraceae bacterium]
MAGISADILNPFLMAGMQMLRDVSQVETKLGKPEAKLAKFKEDTIVIIIGITGEMKGQVMLAFPNEIACLVAGNMCMAPTDIMSELHMSAICELGNMIMGNAATIFSTKGIGIDITPPTVCVGNMTITSSASQSISVPLCLDNEKKIEVYISVKED